MIRNKQSGSSHLIIVVILVAAILGLLGYIGYTKWQEQQKVGPDNNGNSSKQDELKTFSAKINGKTISFKYPKEWQVGDWQTGVKAFGDLKINKNINSWNGIGEGRISITNTSNKSDVASLTIMSWAGGFSNCDFPHQNVIVDGPDKSVNGAFRFISYKYKIQMEGESYPDEFVYALFDKDDAVPSCAGSDMIDTGIKPVDLDEDPNDEFDYYNYHLIFTGNKTDWAEEQISSYIKSDEYKQIKAMMLSLKIE